ncbi:hypothetical protein Nm8I071_36440 [Nonomuraea sp. TT08I-71]|nr:hypothetical protein Nm8I071_36440 [Nonomuraea sp. TT08I-71]
MPLTNPVQRIAVVLERLESPARPLELPPPISSDEPLDDIAPGYAEFLRLSDGAVCGKHRRHPAVVSGLRAADAVGGRRASVVRGDATRLASLLPAALAGQVALVVTSPPYGPTVHGLVRPGTDGVAKFDNTYGTDRGNLAYRDLTGLTDGFEQILTGCAALLRPGGTVVVTARPWRKAASSSTCPPRSSPPACAPAWSRPSGASRSSPRSAAGTSSPSRRSSSSRPCARLAPAALHCT